MLEQKRRRYLRDFIWGGEQRQIRKPSRMGGGKREIHNNIFNFRQDAPIEKQISNLFVRRIICKEK